MMQRLTEDNLADRLEHFTNNFYRQYFETKYTIRDWSLITGSGGGGATKREGGRVKFNPYKTGGGRMLKAGHKKFLGSSLCCSLKF